MTYELPVSFTGGQLVASKTAHETAVNAAIEERVQERIDTVVSEGGAAAILLQADQAVIDAQGFAEDAQDALAETLAAQQYVAQYEYIATAGQSVFTGADVAGRNLILTQLPSVSVAGVAVPPSGVALSVNGATVTLTVGAPVLAGDRVVISGITYGYNVESVMYPELTSASLVQPWGHRWDVKSFQGARAELAKSSGTQDWAAVLQVALRSGERVNIGNGVYPIRSALAAGTGVSVVDVPIDVQAAAAARFVFYGLSFTGGYFDFRSATAASLSNIYSPKWAGGVFDTTNLVSSLEYGITVFDIFNATDLKLDGMKFIGWNAALSSRTVDTAITLHNCPNFAIRNMAVSGVTDSGVYVSGDNNPGPFNMFADGGVIDGIYGFRCENLTTLKRWHAGAHISNFLAVECDSGVLSSPVDGEDDNHGHSAIIRDGRMIRMAGRPIQITGGTDTKISNVIIEDFGHVLSNPATPSDVAADNNIAAIDLRAVAGGSVTNCIVRQRAWAGSTQANGAKLIAGIRLGRYSTSGSVYSSGITVAGNIVENVHRGILEDAGCSDNRFIDNRVKRNATGTYARSAILGTGSVNTPAAKVYSATVNPAAIAAGGRITVPIPAAEASKGDWVQVRLANRDATDVGVEAVVVQPFCADGQVDVILHNQAATSADLANTVFEAHVRPTI